MTDSTAMTVSTIARADATPERPWLGLRAYGPADAAYFYGRDAEVRELYERICSNPLTVLYGRSGLGKSSLLGAGLLPKLKVEGRRAVPIRLRFDADASALGAQVHAALAAAIGESTWPQDLRLWALAHQQASRELIELLRPVLVFDQFEEMFTQAQSPERREQAHALLTELSELIENRPPDGIDVDGCALRSSALHVVLTLREDYLHQLERHKRQLPALMRNRMELLELSGPDALQVVLEPGCKIVTAAPVAGDEDPTSGAREALVEVPVAEAIVRHVAGRLADTALEDIEAVPPLLSLLCAELNAARIEAKAPQITQAQLQGEAEQVLERFYQRSFEGMPGGVRKAVEDLLIDSGGRIREASSRDSVLSEMRGQGVDEPERYLAALVDGRLLTIEERAGAPRVELTHDLLVPLVARARERRQAEEKAEAERVEAERQAAVERERLAAAELAAKQAEEAQWRARLVSVAMAVLFLMALIGGWQTWEWTQVARKAAADAQAAEAKAQAGLKQAAERALGRAREQFALNEASNAAAYLAESLGFDASVASNDAALLVQQSTSPGLETVLEHKDSVAFAAFSPDGTRVVTASADGSARLWDAHSGAAIGVPLEHKGRVESAAFSPDGTRVVTASWDYTARLWDAHSGAAIGTPLEHTSWVDSAAFSPDGRRVVTASWDNTARLWDAHSSAAIGVPLEHKGRVASVAFSPDGRRVVTASADGSARLWDAHSGAAIGAPLEHKGAVWSAAFSRDGRRVVTASMDNTARLWDAQSGAAIGAPLEHKGVVTSAAFSPDGRRVVTASWDHTARLWDARNGAAIGAPLEHKGWVASAAFSPDGRRVVTASWDKTARLWDAQSGAVIGAPLAHKDTVWSAALSPDGRRVVTASGDHTARLWDAQSGAAIGAPLEHTSWVNSAAFSPDGRRVVTASGDNTARFWDAQSGARFWDAQSGAAIGAPLEHKGTVWSAAFSPDGRYVVTAGADGSARLWDAQSGAAIDVPLKHEEGVLSAAFSPDGGRVVTASADGSARLWDAQSGAAIGAPLTQEQVVYSAAFSPDGRRVVTASGDNTARLWDAQSGAAIGAPLEHKGRVKSAAFSPDGTRVVTASADNTARFWDAQSGAAIGAPLAHKSEVESAAFSPDGRRVATASWDNTARLWDAQSGAAIGAPLAHKSGVNSAAFSPDGRRVVTASADGSARLWDVQAAEMLGAPVTPEDLIVLSGRRVADNGQLEWLPGPEWMALIKQVKAVANKGTTGKDQLMRWHFSDPATRTISPFAQITVPQHIEREIAWVLEHPQTKESNGPNYSPKILDDTYNLGPGHPLILLALSVFEPRPETKTLWKRLSFPRFEKDPRLAARAAEILLIDKDPGNARKAAEMALNLPGATEDDKTKAQAVLAKLVERTP